MAAASIGHEWCRISPHLCSGHLLNCPNNLINLCLFMSNSNSRYSQAKSKSSSAAKRRTGASKGGRGAPKNVKIRTGRDNGNKKKTPKNNTKRPFWRRFWRWFWRIALLLIIIGGVIGTVYVIQLDQEIQNRFTGQKWPEPSRLYARPTELFAGARVPQRELADELQRLGYTESEQVNQAGTWRQAGSKLYIGKRPFDFGEGVEPYQRLEVLFSATGIASIKDYATRKELPIIRLDPEMIGSVYPSGGEDRILLKSDDVPELLKKALIAVEDRKFYDHPGIDFKGILRAVWINVTSGEMRQGGSTLTQQLVKNYFLTNARTIRRKVDEAIMAWRMEVHYSKEDILEAYINEIFLSQDGDRAVHGFGLASYYFFGKPLAELGTHQIALLVGIVKGPTAYHPIRRPESALERRNVVLDVMANQGVISSAEARAARLKPLDVVPTPQLGTSRYPAFTELVKRQLRRDYRPEDLRSAGLIVFTTLDTRTQHITEEAMQAHLDAKDSEQEDKLQGAAVMVDVHTGEVSAMVGDRSVRNVGFNRALNARRQIGSLVKPLVYLAALQYPARYTLASPLDNSQLEVERRGKPPWRPKNYSGTYSEPVPLYRALAQSYNLPAIRVGMDIGAGSVNDVMDRLTIPAAEGEKGLPRLSDQIPAGYLGTAEMSPYQVAQIYNSLASGGFVTPLNSIREVLTADHEPLQRYALEIDTRIDAKSVYLINYAMQQVTQIGSGRSTQRTLPDWLSVAGKTGTTNSTRDNWFAGFSGDKLGVVWVGHDDNKSTGLTGSSGALPIWSKVIGEVANEPYIGVPPEGISEVTIDPESGLLWSEGCADGIVLPFVRDSSPLDYAPCGVKGYDPYSDWLNSDPNGNPSNNPNSGQPNQPPPPPDSTRPWWERLF